MAKIAIIFFLCLIFTSYAHADITSGLIGWWQLDEGSGANAVDSSVSANNGTLQNSPPWVSGRIGGALNFNGSNQDVSIGTPASLAITTGTLSAWIKTSNAGNTYNCVALKHNAYGLFLKNNILMIYDWGTSTDRSTGLNLADGLWHHVLVSFQSGVGNGTIIYSDGKSVLTTTMTVSAQGPCYIGFGNAGGQYFNGIIDDVRLYNRVLTAFEVAQVFGAQTKSLNHARLSHFHAG